LPAPSPSSPPRYDMNLLPEVILPRMDLSSCVCVYVCVCDVYIYVFMFNIKSASVLFFTCLCSLYVRLLDLRLPIVNRGA
jgi:hypothetical protein